MVKILLSIYDFLATRRWLLWLLLGGSLLLFSAAITRLRLIEDLSSVLPRDRKLQKLNEVLQGSRMTDKLVVVVSMKDTLQVQPDSLSVYCDSFATRLRRELPRQVAQVEYTVDDSAISGYLETLTDHLPIFLDSNDLSGIDRLLLPGSIRQVLQADLRTLRSPAGLVAGPMISKDPLGFYSLALQKARKLQYDENYQLYGSAVMTRDLKHALLFVTPAFSSSNTGKNAGLLQRLDGILKDLAVGRFDQVEAYYFGASAVAADNAQQLRKDTVLTLGLTVVFLVVFLAWYFRRKAAAVLILLPVLYGAMMALACIALLKGQISVIALGTGSVILGIAVSYSLHVFNHYRHVSDIHQVIRDLAGPLSIGSLTTIGGFGCLQLVHSQILRDLGAFAAFSLIGASFSSLIFLPHFIFRKNPAAGAGTGSPGWLDRFGAWRPDRKPPLLWAVVLLTVVFLYGSQKVVFDADLTHMNYMSPGLRRSQEKLDQINAYSLKSLFFFAEGKNLEEALRRSERLAEGLEALQREGHVRKYSGVSSLVVSDSLQAVRLRRWKEFWESGRREAILQRLQAESRGLPFSPHAFDAFAQMLTRSYQGVDPKTLATVQSGLTRDYLNFHGDSATLLTLVKVTGPDRNRVYETFSQEPGLVGVDRQYLADQLVQSINQDFSSIAWMSSLLVFSVLLITYGRIELTLMSFIPMVVAFIWILGFMGFAGIHFNIVNIILSALIFGLGDDYSLFIMDGLLQEYKTGKKNLSSFKGSILLSAITMLAGLGVLIFARHPALQSIAVVSIVGMVCVVFIAQTLIPWMFSVLVQRRADRGRLPWTAFSVARSWFAFAYFSLGSLLLTLTGFILVRINPFFKYRAKLFYHRLLSGYCRSVIYIMGNVKKTVHNPLQENFSKPAIVICNHQSFLDILLTAMLHPRLILLTNEWVWNSPVFGAVVRMADYLPVADGIENSLEAMRQLIQKGYSLVVFPEGTRSTEKVPGRFHKGAFYLAEQLKLDLLPIVLHGSGHTMGKGDFMLKNGHLSVEFLPRIPPDDFRYGQGYRERTKTIGRYFREKYLELALRRERPRYFREDLVGNFIYKGPVLEWYTRIKTRLEHHYQVFDERLPRQGRILDLGCGYGFLAYLMHFSSPDRFIQGIDYDEEKIAVARHCLSRNPSLQFEAADIRQSSVGGYDAMVLADVLHYLPPMDQEAVLGRCLQALSAGGVLIIREGNSDQPTAHRGTRLTEWFSTQVTGFNKTEGWGLSFLSGKRIGELAQAAGAFLEIISDSKITSNTLFILRKR